MSELNGSLDKLSNEIKELGKVVGLSVTEIRVLDQKLETLLDRGCPVGQERSRQIENSLVTTAAEIHDVDPTFRFPFTVGLTMQTRLPWYFSNVGFQAAGTLFGVSALIGGIRFYRNGKRKKEA